LNSARGHRRVLPEHEHVCDPVGDPFRKVATLALSNAKIGGSTSYSAGTRCGRRRTVRRAGTGGERDFRRDADRWSPEQQIQRWPL